MQEKEKAKKEKAKKGKAKKKKYLNGETPVKIGMRVTAKWQGEGPENGRWFEGEIIAVDEDAKTAHVKFDDGDEDTDLNWFHISIIG